MTLSHLDASRFRMESSFVKVKQTFSDYSADCFAEGCPVLFGAESLMHKIHREFSYAPGTTNISTSVIEAFAARCGVCQDFAHIMLACLRSRGLAARYVSGYLRTTPALGSDAALAGADASHAWEWITSSSPGAGTSAMSRRCAASSSAAGGIVYRFAFRCRRSNIKITKSLPGESVGQAELSSREEAKRGRQEGAPGRKTTAAVERAGGGGCSGRARGARAREICRMT
jgi:hypothetical protein